MRDRRKKDHPRARQHETDEPVWRALSDGTRRAILDALRGGERTTGELCARFDWLTRTAVMRHLDVLETAELVMVRREGRTRWNLLNPMPIQRIHERWISPYIRGLAASASRLAKLVEDREGKEGP